MLNTKTKLILIGVNTFVICHPGRWGYVHATTQALLNLKKTHLFLYTWYNKKNTQDFDHLGSNLPFLFIFLTASLGSFLFVTEYTESLKSLNDWKKIYLCVSRLPVLYLCTSIVHICRKVNFEDPRAVLTQRHCTENILFSVDWLNRYLNELMCVYPQTVCYMKSAMELKEK